MTYRSTHIDDDGAFILAGTSAPSSAASPGETAKILIFPTQTAANYGFWGDAGEPMDLDDDVYPIGFLAVKLTASWSLPRLQVLVAADPAWED